MERYNGRFPNVLPIGAVEPITEMDLVIAKIKNDGSQRAMEPENRKEKGMLNNENH